MHGTYVRTYFLILVHLYNGDSDDKIIGRGGAVVGIDRYNL